MTEQAPTPADIATGIRTNLATIRHHWHTLANPPTTPGLTTHTPAGSRLPGNDTAISLRAEVTTDLAFWVHAYLDHHPTALTDWVTLDLTDIPRVCRFLTDQAATLATWDTYGERLWAELDTLAREVKAIANPPRRDTMPIGECPECDTVVRAKAHDPGNIKCRGCGTTDTLDGWILRIVGNEPTVTAEQLVPILRKRLGMVVKPGTIRSWASRGVIPPACEVDERGRARYDRKAVFHALVRWEARRDTPNTERIPS